jgi:hypothetical protein
VALLLKLMMIVGAAIGGVLLLMGLIKLIKHGLEHARYARRAAQLKAKYARLDREAANKVIDRAD